MADTPWDCCGEYVCKCGRAQHPPHIRKAIASVAALDYSEEMEAHDRARGQGPFAPMHWKEKQALYAVMDDLGYEPFCPDCGRDAADCRCLPHGEVQ